MEKQEYAKMYYLEETYWWYRALHDLILRHVVRLSGRQADFRILDAGCGTGGMLKDLPSYNVSGLEYSQDAFPFLKMRGLKKVAKSSIEHIPFKKGIFNLILLLDVLYHSGVSNDEASLRELHSILVPGGWMILHLPAFDWMKSRHDKAVMSQRRYHQKMLIAKMESAGFEIIKITYRNAFLFPAIAVWRLLQRLQKAEPGPVPSDLRPLPEWLNWLLYNILKMESVLLEYVRFPFGLSLFCIARSRK